MRITIQREIDDDTAESFLEIYQDSFAPLAKLAAARQSLTDHEFRTEMADPGVLKFLGWDKDGAACAMAFMANDLKAVPWISPAYFAERFPEHHDRNAIYYYQAMLVRPDHRGTDIIGHMLDAVIRKVAQNEAIAVIDCCRFNVEVVDFPGMVSSVANGITRFDEWEIDSQHYYAYQSYGLLPSEIDLRDAYDVIDLTDETTVDQQGADDTGVRP